MQDRFKFRVWDKGRKCFFNDDEVVIYPNGEESFFNADYDFTECEVEQCTGLNDKNGKLIYEGDIVRVIEQCMTNTLDRSYPMLFNEKTARFGFKHPDGHFFYFTNDDDFSYEIIGNIHENADLLGE